MGGNRGAVEGNSKGSIGFGPSLPYCGIDMSGVGFAKLPTMKTLPTCFASNSCYRLFTILWLLFAFISLRAYPPESEESQTRRADVIAWCDVVSIEILEK